ncbi:DUF3592 domain-containing protein [Flammeovirga sp. SJP92]|uniref:DUF3592 domain-containing protein n=1 Tax=Flammeovirga sp. SJP92 TaxID=1775430 RepID=UPI00078922FE|nr:DUF3592 domain-containing protein [Flammeovirga sp. SJP92]KXX72220.1 hypothetical protein AVL50_01060 [Flammeovirga sp. SJP92]
MKIANFFFALFFLLPGILFLRASWVSLNDNLEFKKYAIETEGKVLEKNEYTESTDDEDVRRVEIVVEFVDQYNEKIKFYTNGSLNHEVGQKVVVMYHKYSPQEAVVKKGQWTGTVLLGLVGFVCTFIGVFVVFGYKIKEKLYPKNKS